VDVNCGIVGLPNVGKSTLFNALTRANAPAANYAFCTIDPNVRHVNVPDFRLAQLAEIAGSQKIIPTTIQFVDIAGLVAGAAQGEGLGNKFLAHIRETDAIAHVVRCFEDKDITHVAGSVDPIRDIEVIHTELALADMETLSNAQLKAERAAKTGDKDAAKEVQLFEKVKAALNQGQLVRHLELDAEEKTLLKRLHLITAKPMFYIANCAENELENNALLAKVQAYAEQEGCQVIPICAAFEAELSQLEPEEREEFLQSLGLKEGGLEQVIRIGYNLLNLITFFTAGPKETHAWTVHKGASAPQAAGRIHTDFEKGFIRAEVIAFNDYFQFKGEQGAKENGRLRLEGKDYIIQDGDVVHFRFNVAR
jgi:hypothetical protein